MSTSASSPGAEDAAPPSPPAAIAGRRRHLLFRADGQLRCAHETLRRSPRSCRPSPLARAIVDVDDDARSAGARLFGGIERRCSARLVAQAGAGDDDDVGSAIGARIDVLDRRVAVGAVFAIERQRKRVGRLDDMMHGARAAAGLARDEPGLDTFSCEKGEHEVADFIVADGSEQCGPQAKTPRADADVGRAAADVGVERGDAVSGTPI